MPNNAGNLQNLCLYFGWRGGTIHQIAEVTGYKVAQSIILQRLQAATRTQTIIKLINRLFYGGTYKVSHQSKDGTRKVFWCDSWHDAMDWVSCALNEDQAIITNTAGMVLAKRG